MTYIIDTFLKQNAVTAITGRPSMDQSFLAEEMAFSVAASMPLFGALAVHRPPGGVVILADSAAGERNLRSRYASWCAARGVAPDAGEIAIVDMEALRKGHRSLNAVFFTELEQRTITPALIVSSTAAAAPTGFYAPEAQAEISLAQYAIGRSGAAVLLAGHTGTQPGADVLSTFDAVWQVGRQHNQTTLTQGNLVIELTDRTVGGNGLVVTRIFDAVKDGEQ